MTEIILGQNKLSDYKKVDKKSLGEGAYGIVYEATYKNDPDMLVAIKQVKCEMENEGFPSTSIRQISLLRQLKSPYIVKLLDVIVEQKTLYIIFEHMNRDLKKYCNQLEKLKEVMNRQLVKKLMYQLIMGINKIHQKRFFHRDLKPANLLLDKDMNLKIADFGLARTYSIPLRPYSHEVVTLWYRAPEILLGSVEYSPAIDMWSIGCIFLQMLILRPFFPGTSEKDQYERIFRELGTPNETIWPGITKLKNFNIEKIPDYSGADFQKKLIRYGLDQNGINLLNSLLCYDPNKRITAVTALNHPYFNDLKNPMEIQN